jgi:hypothetical protein
LHAHGNDIEIESKLSFVIIPYDKYKRSLNTCNMKKEVLISLTLSVFTI